MDTAGIGALVAVITALPLNGILLFIIIVLYRRNEKLTEQLIECMGKKDYPTELIVQPTVDPIQGQAKTKLPDK